MNNSIQPGKAWLDTAGKPIQAHGFSVFYDEKERKSFPTKDHAQQGAADSPGGSGVKEKEWRKFIMAASSHRSFLL